MLHGPPRGFLRTSQLAPFPRPPSVPTSTSLVAEGIPIAFEILRVLDRKPLARAEVLERLPIARHHGADHGCLNLREKESAVHRRSRACGTIPHQRYRIRGARYLQ